MTLFICLQPYGCHHKDCRINKYCVQMELSSESITFTEVRNKKKLSTDTPIERMKLMLEESEYFTFGGVWLITLQICWLCSFAMMFYFVGLKAWHYNWNWQALYKCMVTNFVELLYGQSHCFILRLVEDVKILSPLMINLHLSINNRLTTAFTISPLVIKN